MDGDTQKGPPQPKHLDSFEALHIALFDVLLEREQMAMAVQQHDAEDAVTSAHQAAHSWLSAKAALQRIKARETAAREQRQHAERAIHASHAALVRQFESVLTQIDAYPLHRMLKHLKRCLWVANDESPPEAHSGDGDVAPSDVEGH